MVCSAVPPRAPSGAESPRWNVGREKGMFGISEADGSERCKLSCNKKSTGFGVKKIRKEIAATSE